jgi:hypothetical protein
MQGRRTVTRALSLVTVAASGCATLTPAQQAAVAKVQIVSSDPASDCQNLGTVAGSRDSDGPGGIRGKTVLMGGNTVRVDAKGLTSSDATAFYCPGPKPDPDAEPTP